MVPCLCYVQVLVPCLMFLCFVQVLVPLLGNEKNQESWPQVVTDDVQRHVHNLKSSVFVVSGQVKGKTLLPLPVGSEQIQGKAEEEEEV